MTMGQLITYIRKPTKIYNLSNRSIKYVENVEKSGAKSAPRYKTINELPDDPSIWSDIKGKHMELTKNMQNFNIESIPFRKDIDKVADKLTKPSDIRSLPVNRKSLELVLGYTEPKIIPKGKITVKKFLEMLNLKLELQQLAAENNNLQKIYEKSKKEEAPNLKSHQSSHITQSDIINFISHEYGLAIDDVCILLDYYKIFKIYIPRGNHNNITNSIPGNNKNVDYIQSKSPSSDLIDDKTHVKPPIILETNEFSINNIFKVTGKDVPQIDVGPYKDFNREEMNQKLLNFKNKVLLAERNST